MVKGICPTTWLTGNLHPESEVAHNLLNVDPLFVDFPNHNYNLLPTSPTIDAGAAETRHHLDLDGDGDGIPMPDMGALGYVPAEEFEFTLVLQTPLPNARLATPEVAFGWQWLSETTPAPETWSQIRAFEYQNHPAYLPVLLR